MPVTVPLEMVYDLAALGFYYHVISWQCRSILNAWQLRPLVLYSLPRKAQQMAKVVHSLPLFFHGLHRIRSPTLMREIPEDE